MYPRNSASPPRIAIGAVVQISDGAVQSSGVSVVVRPEGGSETAGGGTISYGASSGIVYYTPTQGETNYTAFVVSAFKTGCIPAGQTVVTSESSVSGRATIGITSDAVTNLQADYDGTGYAGGTIKKQANVTQWSGQNVIFVIGEGPSIYVSSISATARSNIAAAVEAAILNEGDATALLAAISAKVEEFLINEGDATATLAAIAAACNAAVEAGQVGTDAATAAALSPLDAAGVRSAVGLAAANLDTQLAAIDSVTDKLDDTLEDDSGTYRFTQNALEQAPSGGEGGVVGPGAIEHTVTVNSDGNPVDGAEVWVSTDSAGSNVIAGTLHTDAMGQATFMLDAGTYYVWVQRAGVNFTNPTEIEVTE